MISPQFFIESLAAKGITFFAGVPDSLLKSVCAYLSDNCTAENNIIAANEGAAVALAAGYHLATGKIGCVYMQNSGEGNAVNPLLSLMDEDVYHIPALLIIGWRGEPNVHDEPQHEKQGKLTLPLLETMGIHYQILGEAASRCLNQGEAVSNRLNQADEQVIAEQQIQQVVEHIHQTGKVAALVIRKGTFEDYALQNKVENNLTLSREQAIQIVANALPANAAIVSTTGMISRELFEYRAQHNQSHKHDFLTVGSMGHASQIALGIALQQPTKPVFCFDGDGAVLMHLGSMAITATQNIKNYYHIVFNNGAHDSVGGQPTVGLNINLPQIALNLGYKTVYTARTEAELMNLLPQFLNAQSPAFLEVQVKKGNRKDLGRPTTTPIENKEAFMNFLQK